MATSWLAAWTATAEPSLSFAYVTILVEWRSAVLDVRQLGALAPGLIEINASGSAAVILVQIPESDMRILNFEDTLKRWLPRVFAARRAILQPAVATGGSAHDTVASEAPGILMPLRIAQHGLDPGYIAATDPELFQNLLEACGKCGKRHQCASDVCADNADDRLNAYCANTEKLDHLLLR